MPECPDGEVWVPASESPNFDFGACLYEDRPNNDLGEPGGSNNSGGSGALSASQMRQRETLALAGLSLVFIFLLALLS